MYIFIPLTILVLLLGCEDDQPKSNTQIAGTMQVAAMTAGSTTMVIAGTPAGTPAGMPAGTPAGTPAGAPAGTSAGTPAGTLACETMCQPNSCNVFCACPGSADPISFDACINGCCATKTDALCAELCNTLPQAQCTPGEISCVAGSPSALKVCNDMSLWQYQSCPPDQICQDGQCLAEFCIEGSTSCLGNDLLLCQNGEWTTTETCTERCFNGNCVSAACARAEAERSYLGCEYLAVELPNAAYTEFGSTTPNAPIAVVISNSSASTSAIINVYLPDRTISSLVSAVEVITSPVLTYMGPTTTIQSSIKDSSGQIVQSQMMRAENLEIPPKGIATLLLPRSRFVGEGSMIRKNAFKIISTMPVSAYQFSPYCCNYSFSNDASLLIPTTALGQEYLFLGIPTWMPSPSLENPGEPIPYAASMAIVAREDQTVVNFTLGRNAQIEIDPDNQLEDLGNQQWRATLNQQDVLLVKAASEPSNFFGASPQPDLSGTKITANHPVAVFSNHECANYPESLGACDHLEEQILPTDTWGRDFNLVPVATRGQNSVFEMTYWKIIAQNPGATITLSDTFSNIGGAGPGFAGVPDCGQMLQQDGKTLIMGAHGFCEFGAKKAFSLSSDEPMMVMGVISGQASTGLSFSIFDPTPKHAGDPSIFIVPPTRQYRNSYVFLTPETYFVDYVTIVTSPNNTISLDGQPVDLSRALPINGSGQVYQYVELTDGPHILEGMQPFGITVFAYDDYVSYAFTGGLNLTKR